MNPQDPMKICLSGTSIVSLNERFSSLLKHQEDVIDTRINQQVSSASQKNKRLALEMASRPSVLAALRNTSKINNQLGKPSIKDRLGQRIGTGMIGGLRGNFGVAVERAGPMKGFYRRRGVMRQHGPALTLGPQRGQGHKQRGGRVNWARPIGMRGGTIRQTGNSRAQRLNNSPSPSLEELDKQLDEYMSRSKSHLDAQLDAYMAQVDLEEIM